MRRPPPDHDRITRQQVIRLLRACECDAEANAWEQMKTSSPEYLVMLAEAVSLRRPPLAPSLIS